MGPAIFRAAAGWDGEVANDAGRVWRVFVFVLFGGLWYFGILAPAGSKSVVNREGRAG